MRIRHTTVDTELDPITLVATDDAITGLYFRHHVRRPAAPALGPQIPPPKTRCWPRLRTS